MDTTSIMPGYDALHCSKGTAGTVTWRSTVDAAPFSATEPQPTVVSSVSAEVGGE
jgi:hypothetical protein|tara:strand:- start:145 stop:309 length:165 start_codon:yes stop_codon:yes gene_type:complete